MAVWERRISMNTPSKAMLVVAVFSMASLALLGGTTPVFADANTGTTGQPGQSCQSVFPSGPLQPPGFNTNGFNNTATSVYAGSQPQNSGNPNSVSQYDVACYQVAQH